MNYKKAFLVIALLAIVAVGAYGHYQAYLLHKVSKNTYDGLGIAVDPIVLQEGRVIPKRTVATLTDPQLQVSHPDTWKVYTSSREGKPRICLSPKEVVGYCGVLIVMYPNTESGMLRENILKSFEDLEVTSEKFSGGTTAGEEFAISGYSFDTEGVTRVLLLQHGVDTFIVEGKRGEEEVFDQVKNISFQS